METTIVKKQQKRRVTEELLKSGDVFVHLDPRRAGVVVPENLRKQPHLTLQLGYDMVIPILDLSVADDGITATLSFSRVPFLCFVPWEAVFIVGGNDSQGIAWAEDIPSELIQDLKADQKKERHLRSV